MELSLYRASGADARKEENRMDNQHTRPKISFETESAGSFQKVVGVLSNLIEEGTFTLSQEGIRLREMDNARICLIEVKIPCQQFWGSKGWRTWKGLSPHSRAEEVPFPHR